jgi:proprotein convertase subtilisin/kexin type 5
MKLINSYYLYLFVYLASFIYSLRIARNNQDDFKRKKASQLIEADVSTLVEVPVSYSTGISYYYPYFYKAHLITFSEDSNNFFNFSQNANYTCDSSCDLCLAENTSKCIKCSSGYYLEQDQCLTNCPQGKIADILRSKCMTKQESESMDVVFSKAYSLGSCRNMCGKLVQDCSCTSYCKLKGNCCTDYEVVNCDIIMENTKNLDQASCKSSGCETCELIKKTNSTINNTYDSQTLNNSSSNGFNNSRSNSSMNSQIICTQCPEDKFLHKGKCLASCPQGFYSNSINRFCKDDILSKNKGINC